MAEYTNLATSFEAAVTPAGQDSLWQEKGTVLIRQQLLQASIQAATASQLRCSIGQ